MAGGSRGCRSRSLAIPIGIASRPWRPRSEPLLGSAPANPPAAGDAKPGDATPQARPPDSKPAETKPAIQCRRSQAAALCRRHAPPRPQSTPNPRSRRARAGCEGAVARPAAARRAAGHHHQQSRRGHRDHGWTPETACTTPCSLDAAPGRHTVAITMPGTSSSIATWMWVPALRNCRPWCCAPLGGTLWSPACRGRRRAGERKTHRASHPGADPAGAGDLQDHRGERRQAGHQLRGGPQQRDQLPEDSSEAVSMAETGRRDADRCGTAAAMSSCGAR